MKKLKTFDSIYFRSKSHFEEDGTHNFLVFQPIQRCFKIIYNVDNKNYVYHWKSKGLSDENSIKTTDNGLTPYLDYYDVAKIRLKFNGACLKQDHPTIIFYNGIINFHIVYEIADNLNVKTYPTLENYLFGMVKLTKSAYIDKYGYSSYGIRFDRKDFFHILLEELAEM